MTECRFTRLLGCRDGLAHALISVQQVKHSLLGPANAYLPPKRHTRKRQAVMNKVAEIEAIAAIIERQLDGVKEALASCEKGQ